MSDAEAALIRLVPITERAIAAEQALAHLLDQLIGLIVALGDRELRTTALRLAEDTMARMQEHIP